MGITMQKFRVIFLCCLWRTMWGRTGKDCDKSIEWGCRDILARCILTLFLYCCMWNFCSLCCYPLKAILRWLGYPFTQCAFCQDFLTTHEFLLVILHTKSVNFSTCGAILEVVFEIEWRATYFGSLTAKVILAPLGMPKWVWPSMNWYRLFFIQPSTILSSMHQKLGKWKSTCKLTNSCPKVALR